jgi:hypothetical protein
MFIPAPRTFTRYVFILILLASGLMLRAQTGVLPAPYLDPTLTLNQRVNDLVGRMTLAEKVSQMQNKFPDTTGGTKACMAWLVPAMPRCFRRPSVWRPHGIRA